MIQVDKSKSLVAKGTQSVCSRVPPWTTLSPFHLLPPLEGSLQTVIQLILASGQLNQKREGTWMSLFPFLEAYVKDSPLKGVSIRCSTQIIGSLKGHRVNVMWNAKMNSQRMQDRSVSTEQSQVLSLPSKIHLHFYGPDLFTLPSLFYEMQS